MDNECEISREPRQGIREMRNKTKRKKSSQKDSMCGMRREEEERWGSVTSGNQNESDLRSALWNEANKWRGGYCESQPV